MYKSVDQIEKLRNTKLAALESVYDGDDLDEVYKKQNVLGAMSISIFTDVANVVIPTLQDDGVGNIVWPGISRRLKKLSFISVPTATEIREKYKQSIASPTVVNIKGTQPRPGTRTDTKKIALPTFLTLLAGQGIAVPLLLSFLGGSKWALVKIIPCTINAALMVIEVVKYFNWGPAKRKTVQPARRNINFAAAADYDSIYHSAIQEVRRDNCKRLNDWFDTLKKITVEEIEKELHKSEE